MEPFPHNKAEGAKKVIVATSSPSNHVLRARPSKVSSSPRHIKLRRSKTYSGTDNANVNLLNISWPSLGHQISPGNSSPQKTPLGLYRHGGSFDNSHSGLPLDSNTFLSDSSVARFNATLFSPAAAHHSQDVEEAMDIDHQDGAEEAASASSASVSVSRLPEGNGCVSDQPRGVEDTNLTEACPTAGEANSHTLNTKPMEAKQEQRVSPPNPDKRVTASSVVQKSVSSSLPNKKKAIYIVLHVSTIQIGELVGKASAPVKIYEEKVFIEMDTNEGKDCQSTSYYFRIPCKDLAECKVNFDGPPFLLVAKPTPSGAGTIQEKCTEKGKFLDPDNHDIKKRYIVLVLNYKVMPKDIKADLVELFQNRFADKLAWSELSSKQAQEILERKEEACSAVGASPAHSPKPASPVNLEHRKILTPKGKNARKKLFTEGRMSPSNKDTTAPSKTTTEDALPGCTEGKSKEQNDAPGGAMLTRSRRRKASQVTNSSPEKPVPTSTKPVKPDILLHHKEMESHITLLDQHSKEQRENLQQHQRLLELERGKLRDVEEENERQLGRMRDLEISFSADKERLLERIRVLESALGEKDQAFTQQTVNLTLMNNELEEERVSLRQIQKELEQEREANSVLQKVQSDLVRLTLALDEEKVVRNLREQQLREKENNFHGLQATLGEEQQARLRLEGELRQARSACTQLERTLENERLSSQSNLQEVQMKDDTIREQMRLLQQEREAKTSLEDRIRNLEIQVAEESNRRISTERELTEERSTLQQDRENLERERERNERRIQESERTVNESERRLRELQSAVSAAQDALAEYRRLEPRDWIIRREEVILSQKSLGVGAWGKVFEGTFRGCQVAVKQIHDLILSPHNRRLFEREMSIASRCRHPHLLQFIGATNDDGSPLFVTELLDTDLRRVLIQRALHHEDIVFIALDVAKGLNYLHLNKPFPIIHRDISSSNVLLWRRGDSWRAKLSDYGAANFMRQYMTANPGARIYAAPEALTSQQSTKADVYSFGLLLCEMCIRELPVPQQIQEQIGLVTNGVFRELIMRCVMPAPEARPTISDVIAVLTQQAEALRAQGLVALNGRTATL